MSSNEPFFVISRFKEDVSWIKDNWQSHADGRGNHTFVISCGESR